MLPVAEERGRRGSSFGTLRLYADAPALVDAASAAPCRLLAKASRPPLLPLLLRCMPLLPLALALDRPAERRARSAAASRFLVGSGAMTGMVLLALVVVLLDWADLLD